MKAIVYEEYGPPEVLRLTELPKPLPKENEVLIKIYATTVHRGDVIMRSLQIPGPGWQRFMARLYLGFRKPKRPVLGMELAGDVESVGGKVQRFQPGDQVFASTVEADFGAYAEYKCLSEEELLAPKPANMSYEEAAAVPNGGMTALCLLRQAGLQPGQQVLIYGASGSVGTFAVQLARQFGAEVAGVCSTANMQMVRSLGANRVFDYTREDFTQSTATYDVIVDAVGKLDAAQGKKALKPHGRYLDVVRDSDKCKLQAADLITLKELIEAGELQAVIDRRYALEEIVEAHRYVDRGHKKGNVAITVAHNDASSEAAASHSRRVTHG